MVITYSRMEREVYSGDWHDTPLRWEVLGPEAERQMFSTRDDARRYASIRRKAPDFNTASSEYIRRR